MNKTKSGRKKLPNKIKHTSITVQLELAERLRKLKGEVSWTEFLEKLIK